MHFDKLCLSIDKAVLRYWLFFDRCIASILFSNQSLLETQACLNSYGNSALYNLYWYPDRDNLSTSYAY